MIAVSILTSQKILFQGQASSIIFPGVEGTFEVLPFPRPLVSRLLSGLIWVDGQAISIRRGVVKVDSDTVIALVEG